MPGELGAREFDIDLGAMVQKKKHDTGRKTATAEADKDLGSLLKSEVGERPRVEVRVLKIGTNGKLEELSCFPLSYYGSCPNVGDTILDGVIGEVSHYSIQRRYFIAESIYFSGWALIVREIDPAAPAAQLWEEWQDATNFWDDVAEQKQERIYESVMSKLQSTAKQPANKPTLAPKAKIRRKRVLKPRES